MQDLVVAIWHFVLLFAVTTGRCQAAEVNYELNDLQLSHRLQPMAASFWILLLFQFISISKFGIPAS